MPDVCGAGQCVNVPGGFLCNCTGGISPTPDKKSCIGKFHVELVSCEIEIKVIKKFLKSFGYFKLFHEFLIIEFLV